MRVKKTSRFEMLSDNQQVMFFASKSGEIYYVHVGSQEEQGPFDSWQAAATDAEIGTEFEGEWWDCKKGEAVLSLPE